MCCFFRNPIFSTKYGGGGENMVLNMGPILRGEITRMDISYELTPEPIFDVTFPENAKELFAIGKKAAKAKYEKLRKMAE